MIDPGYAASLALLLPSATYLSWRTYDFWSRQHTSYLRLPYPAPGWTPGTAATPAQDRARAALLAIAAADALGMHREFIPPALARLRWGARPALSRGVLRWMRRAGSVSDDTQHTWMLATCIDDAGALDSAAWRAALAGWWSWRVGPGAATQRAIRRIQRGVTDSGDATSQGNGAAMRVAPLAIALGHDPARLDAACTASALPTHAHPEAIEGARQTAHLIAWCLSAPAWDLDLARAACAVPDAWGEVWARADAAPPTSGWVRDTLRAAIWLLDRHHADIPAGLTALYALGGDVDSIGAIYAACAGALHGTAAVIPCAPLDHIQGTHLLVQQADRLHASALAS
jgi:ADP-ribosylglycohydrolase